jgi:hypothetical protein
MCGRDKYFQDWIIFLLRNIENKISLIDFFSHPLCIIYRVLMKISLFGHKKLRFKKRLEGISFNFDLLLLIKKKKSLFLHSDGTSTIVDGRTNYTSYSSLEYKINECC